MRAAASQGLRWRTHLVDRVSVTKLRAMDKERDSGRTHFVRVSNFLQCVDM